MERREHEITGLADAILDLDLTPAGDWIAVVANAPQIGNSG